MYFMCVAAYIIFRTSKDIFQSSNGAFLIFFYSCISILDSSFGHLRNKIYNSFDMISHSVTCAIICHQCVRSWVVLEAAWMVKIALMVRENTNKYDNWELTNHRWMPPTHWSLKQPLFLLAARMHRNSLHKMMRRLWYTLSTYWLPKGD